MNSEAFKMELLLKQVSSEAIKNELATLKLMHRLLKLRQSLPFYKLLSSLSNPPPIVGSYRPVLNAIERAKPRHWITAICDYSDFELAVLFSTLNTLFKFSKEDLLLIVNFQVT